MKLTTGLCIGCCLLFSTAALSMAEIPQSPERQSWKVIVDKNGIMRRSDNSKEVAYYGTNYTTPFAHAFRALGYKGVDRKKAIQRDVYHLARLGLNGFRLHLWDAEFADSAGNLQANEHLDLLDYLIAELEKYDIDIVLTAQTNFGNGYPERNIDTGAFTYDFDKCRIHDDKKAQDIQKNYLSQLVKHVNPYTGMSYGGDNAIIALEINNEPCHSGSRKEVADYIRRMAKEIRRSGFDKPVLYNVSHNPEVTEAYYDTDVEGTTYQWYPTGLVAGHERKGNFLPYIDSYDIPWKGSIHNYGNKAKVVYEFDPGDVLASYLYPAIARTMRGEGFQWITQFAYDPTDIAAYNTEYQTHYLNLAYTPQKAISMMIAAEATRELPRGCEFGNYPTDTIFGDFTVSYRRDLSEFNSPEKFYYTNSTSSKPKDAERLRKLAGHHSSPAVDYEGNGAYFLDRINKGVWRLEVMPDVVLSGDPFEKPSLNRKVGHIIYREHPMTINIPDIADNFFFKGINDGNHAEGTAKGRTIDIMPGTYIIAHDKDEATNADVAKTPDGLPMNRFSAPKADAPDIPVVKHIPTVMTRPDEPLQITAEVFSPATPDSVAIYPSTVSFWREKNPVYTMHRTRGYEYSGELPPQKEGRTDYNIVVFCKDKTYTYPQGTPGTPLDWDTDTKEYYSTAITGTDTPVTLFEAIDKETATDVSPIDEGISAWGEFAKHSPVATDGFLIRMDGNKGLVAMRRYAGSNMPDKRYLKNKKQLRVITAATQNLDKMEITVITQDGISYSFPINAGSENVIPLDQMQQTSTLIIPAPFPTFLKRYVEIDKKMPLKAEDIESVELRLYKNTGPASVEIKGVILE